MNLLKPVVALAITMASTGVQASYLPAGPFGCNLYGNANFDGYEWPGVWKIKMNQSTNLKAPRDWGGDRKYFRNETSAVTVRQGCTLTLYDDSGLTQKLESFEGPGFWSAAREDPDERLNFNNMASSASCDCDE